MKTFQKRPPLGIAATFVLVRTVLLVAALAGLTSGISPLHDPDMSTAKVIFSKEGMTPQYITYGVITFPVDLTELNDQIVEAKNLLLHFKEKTDGNEGYMTENHQSYDHITREVERGANPEFYEVLGRFHNMEARCSKLIWLFEDVYTLRDKWRVNQKDPALKFRQHSAQFEAPSHHSSDHQRHARAANDTEPALDRFDRGALTIAAIGAGTMGIAWLASEIYRALQPAAYDPYSDKMKDDWLHLGFTANDTAQVMDKLAYSTRETWAVHYSVGRFHTAADVLERRLDHIIESLEMASRGRLSTSLLATIDYGATVAAVDHQAAILGLRMIGHKMAEWLQYEAGYIETEVGFTIKLFIPLYKTSEVMTIYRYHPLPIPLAGNIHLNVDAGPYSYVAVSHDMGSFRPMTEATMRGCRRAGEMTFCDMASYVRHAPKTDNAPKGRDDALCIYALAARRFKLATATCSSRLTAQKGDVTQVAPRRFAAYSNTPITARVRCPLDHTTRTITISNVSLIDLPPNCQATTPEYSFASADETFSRDADEWMIHYDWPYTSLDAFTNNTDPYLIGRVALKTKRLRQEASTLVEDIATHEMEAEQEKWYHINAAPSATEALALLLSSIACIMAGLALWLTIKTNRIASASQPPTAHIELSGMLGGAQDVAGMTATAPPAYVGGAPGPSAPRGNAGSYSCVKIKQ